MREIKFRAWDNNNNAYYKEGRTKHGGWSWFNVQSDGTFVSGVDDEIDEPSHKSRFILEQFTGLKDKNGVELAAGDKYKWLGWEVRAGKQIRPERIETIRNDTTEHWIEDCHRLWCISTGNSQGTVEVIGNIHEEQK